MQPLTLHTPNGPTADPDVALSDPRCRMLLGALVLGPLSWGQLSEAGLDRPAVFQGIDLGTAAGLAVFRVGPELVERLDLSEEELP